MEVDTCKRIFVVHGRDVELLSEVKAYLKEKGWVPVILADERDGGKTIIEKIEKYSDVQYALILYTPCDVGRLRTAKRGKPRARQNVVLEHGFFMGKLGRERVIVIHEEGVERPTDIDGVVYTPRAIWKEKLAREILCIPQESDAASFLRDSVPSFASDMQSAWTNLGRTNVAQEVKNMDGIVVGVLSLLMSFFGTSRPSDQEKTGLEILERVRSLCELLKPYMGWAEFPSRCEEEAEKKGLSEEEKREAVDSLLRVLSEEQRKIMWLCSLCMGKDFCDCSNVYRERMRSERLWECALEQNKNASFGVFRELLRQRHEANQNEEKKAAYNESALAEFENLINHRPR